MKIEELRKPVVMRLILTELETVRNGIDLLKIQL